MLTDKQRRVVPAKNAEVIPEFIIYQDKGYAEVMQILLEVLSIRVGWKK